MPAFSPSTQPDDSASEISALKCKTCGKSFAPPAGHGSEASARLVDEESARCARLREITQQRRPLADRAQAGIAGGLGSDTLETIHMVPQRESLPQLDAALEAQADEFAQVIFHPPGQPTPPLSR